MRVRIPKLNIGFDASPDQPLLDAALNASLNLPHSCKGGNCGSCVPEIRQLLFEARSAA